MSQGWHFINGKLDGFLKLNEREMLTHAGHISAKFGDQKAEKEYDKYWVKQRAVAAAAATVSNVTSAVRQIQHDRTGKPKPPATKKQSPFASGKKK